MTFISKSSLEILKEKVDLAEVISSFIKLHRSGSHYKGLCPFHNEKTPSFGLGAGDKHYHCFGCGAHGDAIAFLMEYSKLTFKESLSYLAEKYQVSLEEEAPDESKILKKQLKEVMEAAEEFYHFCLLHTYEGEKALKYALSRQLSLDFIQKFHLGYSPKNGVLFRYLKVQGFSPEVMYEAGLYNLDKRVDFFHDRFMIPIHDPVGRCIGFTARKLDEETFGGKYVNTPETALFKKSQVLFGLKFSRARIIKEKKALICEGQIDAMRLIDEGFDYTVASQGTAFGLGHVQLLKQLGVRLVYLAFDGDHAGIQAAIKVGEYFMQSQITVHVVGLPSGKDPDAFLLSQGKKGFDELLHQAPSYLEFLYETLKAEYDLHDPTLKNRFIQDMKLRIQEFKDPVLIYESLKKLSELADIPERVLGVQGRRPSGVYKEVSPLTVNKDYVLDLDVLRFFYLAKLQKHPVCELFVKEPIQFESELTSRLFEAIKLAEDLEAMPFVSSLETDLHPLFEALFEKKVNRLKIEEGSKEALLKLLERAWLKKRREVQEEIEKVSDEKDQLKLTLKLALLIKNPPKL